MLITFLTTDLVFPSRVAAVAQMLGALLETAATPQVLLAKLRDSAEQTAVVLLDLNLPNIDPTALMPQLKSLKPTPTVIAFGPHVHQQKLAAAQAAGCDVVLTRGQFDSQMHSILAQIASQAAQGTPPDAHQ